jgi:hypothetical protein
MQRLYVSGAVRPLKWTLGVKWLTTLSQLHETLRLQFVSSGIASFVSVCVRGGRCPGQLLTMTTPKRKYGL